MADRALLIAVRWLDGRFHGVREANRDRSGAYAPEWPPSPFRLFQALVAGAFGGRWIGTDDLGAKISAFEWLESLPPPVIAAPRSRKLRATTYYVPNNDLDAKGGDPERVGEIRVAKVRRPSLFEASQAVLYRWTFDGDGTCARLIAEYAERLHTLGHGIDAAFAHAELLDGAEAEARLQALDAMIQRPASRADVGGSAVPCPARGSLASLFSRHGDFLRRLEVTGEGRGWATLFRSPRKAHARSVVYDQSAVQLLFELRGSSSAAPFAAWPLQAAGALVIAVRDLLAARLGPKRLEVERLVMGRGAGPTELSQRLRLVPLPSIGSPYADHSIRRVLVEVPPDCSLPADEVRWALAGRALPGSEMISGETGEVVETLLVPTTDAAMLGHYGAGERIPASRRWRTVSPAALPETAGRRRIDPERLAAKASGEAKAGAEREVEEKRAEAAVLQALRHAGVVAPAIEIKVQREPFDAKGARAEAFAPGTRFPKERLWHAEVLLREGVSGPLLVGDGRFLGLGLMRPATEPRSDLYRFIVASDRPLSDENGPQLLKAVRRALMSRAGDASKEALVMFSGHEPDGAPARTGQHRHVYLALAEGVRSLEVYVVAPWRVDRSWRPSASMRREFARVASGLEEVRAGRLGVIRLRTSDDGDAPLARASRSWKSATPYLLDRHPRRGEDLIDAAVADIEAACVRLGLPRPEVDISGRSHGPRVSARLTFGRLVRGPILLGRDAHLGGGLFVPQP